jgi:hypothetical protein
MFSTLAQAAEQGLAAGLAYQLNPQNQLMGTMLENTMDGMQDRSVTLRLENVKTATTIVQHLIDTGADGQSVKIYQEIEQALANRLKDKLK